MQSKGLTGLCLLIWILSVRKKFCHVQESIYDFWSFQENVPIEGKHITFPSLVHAEEYIVDVGRILRNISQP